MNIRLYQTSDDRRVINKTLSWELVVTGKLKAPLTTDTVQMPLSSDIDISKYNYMIIDKKCYFINDITKINNDIYMVSFEIDRYETYKEDILQLKAILDRSDSEYNRYLPDEHLRTVVYPRVQTRRFPRAFSPNGNAILVVTGG